MRQYPQTASPDRQATGEVLIDTQAENSGYISAYTLESNGHFLPEEFTPPFDVILTWADDNSIYQFADLVDPGKYSLGNILPAGLKAGDLETLFTEARYLGRAGFSGGHFEFEVDAVPFALVFVAVPEPQSMLICIVSGVLGITWSKRWR